MKLNDPMPVWFLPAHMHHKDKDCSRTSCGLSAAKPFGELEAGHDQRITLIGFCRAARLLQGHLDPAVQVD